MEELQVRAQRIEVSSLHLYLIVLDDKNIELTFEKHDWFKKEVLLSRYAYSSKGRNYVGMNHIGESSDVVSYPKLNLLFSEDKWVHIYRLPTRNEPYDNGLQLIKLLSCKQ